MREHWTRAQVRAQDLRETDVIEHNGKWLRISSLERVDARRLHPIMVGLQDGDAWDVLGFGLHDLVVVQEQCSP